MTTEADQTDLETQIHLAYYRFLSDGSKESWWELAALIKQRSPQQVERMEKAKGLG